MNSIVKKEQFCQVKQSIKKNRKHLIVGIDVGKKSSTACFYNIEKEILLKKYLVRHDIESFQRFVCKIEQIKEIDNFQDVIIGVEPTANYHKPISEYLRKKDYFMVYVSSVAAKSNRKTIDGGRWGKNDPRDAYNVVDLMCQGKILYYRDENTQSTDIRKYLLLRQRLTKTKSSLKTRIRNNIWACYFPELCSLFKNAECPDVLTLLEHGLSSQTIKNMDYSVFVNLFSDSIKSNNKQHSRLSQVWQNAKTSIGLPMPSASILEGKLIARDIKKTQKDIAEIDKILSHYCMQNDVYYNLFSIPGFGVFTTAVFKSVIADINTFSHDKQLVKLAGLDIETMTSGKFAGKEKISKKGSSLLRFAVCHATNVAISKNKVIGQMFQKKLKERGNSKEAKAKLKIKFAEKILRAAFVIMKHNVPFNINIFSVPVDDPVLNSVKA